ncbi:hypothetical protein QL285_051180 [Trifolium repens]|nr:hypothetical protein QL285_051180 [Trifolium repens]
MENSKNQNDNLSVNKLGKTIQKNRLQQTIDFRNNVVTTCRIRYIDDKVNHIHKDDFKSFVQRMTGKQSNGSNTPTGLTRLQKLRPPPLSIVRPQVSVQVSALVAPIPTPYNVLPTHNLKSITSSPSLTSKDNLFSPRSPYRPLLSPSIFSSPSSPEYPFHPYIQNNDISNSGLESPLSAGIFPFTSPKRTGDQ